MCVLQQSFKLAFKLDDMDFWIFILFRIVDIPLIKTCSFFGSAVIQEKITIFEERNVSNPYGLSSGVALFECIVIFF